MGWIRGLLSAGVSLAFALPPAAAAAADEPEPSWQFDSSILGQKYSLAYTGLGANVDGTAEQVELELVRFLTPLRDDGSPYSIQPFLQRTSRWWLTFDGGHFATHNPFGNPDRTDWNGSVAGSVDAYLHTHLALTGNLAYRYDTLHDVGLAQTTHAFAGGAGLGVRAADTRLDVSYQLLAQDTAGSFSSPRQLVTLALFSAIARRFTVSLSGTRIPGGNEGTLSLEYFATREIGPFVGGFAGRGKLYSSDLVVTRYRGWAGLAGWIDSSTALVGQYAYEVDDIPADYHQVTHTISLEVYARFDRL
jgi:hypothetical protein